MNIVFICTGNTCRSPMAEALLKDKYPEASVKSAGIFAANGAPASQHALDVLNEKNITCQHRSQPVTDELMSWADLVLTMTMQHQQVLVMEYPSYQHKVFTLKEYVSEEREEIQRLEQTIETKRRQYIASHPDLSSEQLEQHLDDVVEEEVAKLRQLEARRVDMDISDPFGGDLALYRATRNELEKQIDRLIHHIQATKED